jgi:glyoxylase I family protein
MSPSGAAATQTVRWSHVGLNCRDQAVTEEFYRRLFGFTRARVIDAGDVRVVFLRRGDACLELFATPDATPATAQADGPQTPGTARHLAFQVDDLDAFLAEAGDVQVSLGPLDFDEVIPGWRTLWIKDPDGVVVEVSQGYVDQTQEELAATP